MVCLEELAQGFKSARMEIESVARINIEDLPENYRDHCSKSAKRERTRVKGLGQDPNDAICALYIHIKTGTCLLVLFVFHDEKDPYEGRTGQANTTIDCFCKIEVNRIHNCIVEI